MVADGKIPPASPKAEFATGRTTSDVESSSLNDVGKDIGEAFAAARVYLSAQVDRLRAAVRNLVILSIVAIVAFVFAATVLIYATVLLLTGVAEAIGSQLGGRQWAGDLITGAVVLGGLAIVGFVIVSKTITAARLRTMSSYAKPKVQK